jgi:LacI family transcriptional regulator
VTLQNVAEAAGVSTATVSRVISGHKAITEDTANRVRAAMEALGYEPNMLARALRTRQSQAIGLIVPDIANPYFGEVTKGAERRAAELGYNLILCDSDYDQVREARLVMDLTRRFVDGVLLMPLRFQEQTVQALNQREIPVVLLDVEVGPYARVNAVETGQGRAVYEGTNYLIDLGHERVAFFVSPSDLLPNPGMVEGYRGAMQEHGLPHDDLLIRCKVSMEAAYAAALETLPRRDRPTAVFTIADVMALGIYKAALELNLVIPRDLSVLGFDDMPMASFLNPPLSSMAQDKEEIGRQAVDLLVRQIADGRPSRRIVTMEPRLVVRESCAPPLVEVVPAAG